MIAKSSPHCAQLATRKLAQKTWGDRTNPISTPFA
jgi:hypothetical protein